MVDTSVVGGELLSFFTPVRRGFVVYDMVGAELFEGLCLCVGGSCGDDDGAAGFCELFCVGNIFVSFFWSIGVEGLMVGCLTCRPKMLTPPVP